MSQWSKLTALCRKDIQVQERINELYRRIHFPFKFRSSFADWIEAQEWGSVDCGTNEGYVKAEGLFRELLEKIETAEASLNESKNFNLELSLDFKCAKDAFRKTFECNYQTFVEVLHSCMNEERLLIQSCESDHCELKRKTRQPAAAQEGAQMKHLISSLQHKIGLAENLVQDVAMRQDKFMFEYQQLVEKISHLDDQLRKPETSDNTKKELQMMKTTMEQERDRNIRLNFERRTTAGDTLINLATSLETLLGEVWSQIEKWQDIEKRAITALVSPVEGMLDNLDKICNEAGELYWQLVPHLEELIRIFTKLPYNNDEKLNKLKEMLNDLQHRCLDLHMSHIFVVDRNIPDRVLKVASGKSQSFNMSVRILGGKSLGLHLSQPVVKLSVFQEKEIPDGCLPMNGIFEILNGNDKSFSLVRGVDALTAQFNSIMLKNVKRPDRGKNEELVTELKYAFVFYTAVHVFGRVINLRAISLPVILTSQTSQEIMAKGTLIWDAAFSERDRKPFVYRERVKWEEVAAVLSALFLQNTGSPLSKEHVKYLAKVAFRQKKDLDDYSNKVITEKMVIRDRMPGRDFSFWKWFWANMNLVKNYVKREWQDGLIYGFISKEDARRMMIEQPCGTFLLRFSETSIEHSQKSDVSGCLTLAFVEVDPESGQKKLFHVREYLSPKELQTKELSPVLDAMEVSDYTKPGTKKRLLRYLWPNCTPFEAQFGKYIKEKEKRDGDYSRGKYNIEIFLSNDQSNGRPHGVASDTASCPPTPCPSTPHTVMSPESACDSNDAYSAAFVDYNQVPSSAPQRQMAAVRPQAPFTMLDSTAVGQSCAGQCLSRFADTQQQYPADTGDSQWLSDMQSFSIHGTNGMQDYPMSDANGYTSAHTNDTFISQLLTLDDDGDMMVAQL